MKPSCWPCLALVMATFAVPAAAQTAPAAEVPAVEIPSTENPAAPAADATPARAAATDADSLAVAQSVAGRLWPAGAYRTSVDRVVNTLLDAMAKGEFPIGGAQPDDEDGKARPHLDRQNSDAMRRATELLIAEIAPYFERVEPDIRAALAHVLARRMTADELREIDHFLASPSGTAFAANFLTLFTDPEVAAVSLRASRAVAAEMPGIIERVAPKLAAELQGATVDTPETP